MMRDAFHIGAIGLGIDIGQSTIKMVELRRGAQGLELRRAGVAPTPDRAVEGGVILDRPRAAAAVSALLRRLGIRRRRAVVGVAGQNVLARVVRVPPVPDDEIRQAIRWEAERHLPFPVEESVLDVQSVREIIEEGQAQKEVLLAAAPEGLVRAHLDTLEAARVFVEAVEIGGLAMARAFDRSIQRGTHALVNLGAAATDVAIVHDGVPQFTRTILLGGAQITRGLARELGVDEETAERLKIQYGMGWDGTPPEPQLSRVYASGISGLVEELTTQLRRSLDFYRAQFRGLRVEGMILCGGGARLRHVASHLTTELDLPVNVGAPLDGLRAGSHLTPPDVEEQAPQLAVAIGLAMRTVT